MIIGAAALSIVVIGLPMILTGLGQIMKVFHISSRSLEMFISGKLTSGNGREKIWGLAQEMLSQNSLTGYGFYGDRFFIGQTWTYGYPHNIAYEMWIQMGAPIGSLILGGLVYGILRMFFTCRNVPWSLLLTLMVSSCMKLILSDSFWYNWHFWALIGILLTWAGSVRESRENEQPSESINTSGTTSE